MLPSRDRLILIACTMAMLGAGLVLFWPGEVAATPRLPTPGSENAAATAPDEPVARLEADAPRIADVAAPRSESPAASLPPGEWRDGTGTIEGYLMLSVDVLRQIEAFTITVEEERNEKVRSALADDPTWRVQRGFKVDPSVTPRFRIEDVPFSRRGYRVAVYVPGFNGSFRVVRLDSGRPFVPEEECVLSLTEGVPYSVRLFDQLYRPVVDTLVRMEPTGDQMGLSAFEGQTDSFGNVLFESVLQGSYKVFVGDRTTPFVEPPVVQVAGHTPVYTHKPVAPQGTTIEVPTGQEVVVETIARGAGYGLEGIQVTLRAFDSTRHLVLETTTDFGGYARFPHVIAGTYQITASHPTFHRRDRQITVEDGVTPDALRIEMVARR
jgi:hypothetical protein